MSVLSLPRLYFSGEMASNPDTPNNYPKYYNASENTAELESGETDEEFHQKLLDNVNKETSDDWNVYGDNGINFVDYDDTLARKTVISGGALPNGQALPSNDPLIGTGVQIQGNIFNDKRNPGRLVDVDPYSSGWGSQIFFDRLVIGDENMGLVGQVAPHRTYAYWIGTRNIAGQAVLQIAGGASVIFQVAIPTSELQFFYPENSTLLAALEAAVNQDGVQGLMVRFSAYRTLYYQNGQRNHISPTPRNADELRYLYVNDNEIFNNPAYTLIVGSVGLWKQGELATAPSGRYLGTATSFFPINASSQKVSLKPMLAELNGNVLSLDALDTFPEFDKEANKLDIGNVNVQVINAGIATDITTLTYSDYNKTAYEATAGIIDINLTDDLVDKIASGQLALSVSPLSFVRSPLDFLRNFLASRQASDNLALAENEYVVLTDDRGIYLEEDTTPTCTLHVFHKGQPAAAGTNVLLAQYHYIQKDDKFVLIGNDDPNRYVTLSAENITVGDAGTATFEVTPVNAGGCLIAFLPYTGATPPSPELDPEYGYFTNIRVMPFNNQLADSAQTPDSSLTWDFMYENIFRVYNLVYPVMSEVIPMDNRNLMEGAWMQIMGVIGESDDATHTSSMFESTMYMSVTRDLSYGHREALRRWCILVSRDSQP